MTNRIIGLIRSLGISLLRCSRPAPPERHILIETEYTTLYTDAPPTPEQRAEAEMYFFMGRQR